jgi:hypothetical protein
VSDSAPGDQSDAAASQLRNSMLKHIVQGMLQAGVEFGNMMWRLHSVGSHSLLIEA